MISRRNFVAFLSAVPLVGNAFAPTPQHNPLPPGHPAPESNEQAWAQFASDLADALADLDEDEFLIITTKKDGYYVQFAAQGNFGMRLEATSNAYTDDNNKLSEQACAKLLNLGWNAPTCVPDDFHPERHDPDGSPNYFLDVGVPLPYGSVASLAVNTLRAVFGATHPGELQYKAFANRDGNIRFPNLRIARER